ncbi:Uma2 family endonuclease [Bathymodiolus japonicus methanotrophic gill symbiont]|uniref:Uma2 family endonuclease n=1 Tax=Bathymodiolus japonicus methanotrophic gill symbiont TaxID=113269 RepID=UPI001C8DE12C|nr:Uma2 family endonuclease [Bathymodiolus japonicus methanotrophic gill symbiont]
MHQHCVFQLLNNWETSVKDTAYHNYTDYLQWTDNNYELIDGEAYFMAPAPNLEHQEVVGDIYFQLRLALAGKKCRAFIAPIDVRLAQGQDDADELVDTVIQPDVLVVCDENKLDRRGVRGAPDWVLEVLSPATASHDQIKKRDLYERHGVREYWLVHPTDRVLTIYLLEGKEFSKPRIVELSGETALTVLDDVLIQWDDLLTRLPLAEDLY